MHIAHLAVALFTISSCILLAQDAAPLTRRGVPAVHMWHCPMPQPNQAGAGFPILNSARHVTIYTATRETGAYSHHPHLIWHSGRFHASWSNHPHGEDGPGQRVLYSWSEDAESWSPFQELFPPPGPVKPSEETGMALAAGPWRVLDGRLCATAGCYENAGFKDIDGKSIMQKRDREHPFRLRKRHGRIAREVRTDGSFGPFFRAGRTALEGLAYPVHGSDDPAVRDIAVPLRRLPRPWPGRMPRAIEGHPLCEPTFYRAADGKWVMLARDDTYSHRLYVSVYDDAAKTWPAAQPTDIPDSPSKTCRVRLDDGTILLIGNQMAPAFDNWHERRHYGRDPLTVAVSKNGYRFTQVFALRCGQQQWRVPRREILGRGGGGQYPDAIVREGVLHVIYSMGKEDIAVSSVSLSDLGIK